MLIAGIAILLLVIVAGLWYVRRTPVVSPEAGSSPAPEQSLGGQIYEQSNNPIAGKVETSNPAENANPLKEVYKNPFE